MCYIFSNEIHRYTNKHTKIESPPAHRNLTTHLFPTAIVIHQWVAAWPWARKCTKHDYCCNFSSVLSTVLRSVSVPQLSAHTQSYRCTFSPVVLSSQTTQTDFTLTPTPLMQTKTEPLLEPCMGVDSAALGYTMLGRMRGRELRISFYLYFISTDIY